MERNIRIGVYRILRKLGAFREDISVNAKLSDLFEIDETEWNCFLFFLESRFNINISPENEQKLITVANTIETVQQIKNAGNKKLNASVYYTAEVA